MQLTYYDDDIRTSKLENSGLANIQIIIIIERTLFAPKPCTQILALVIVATSYTKIMPVTVTANNNKINTAMQAVLFKLVNSVHSDKDGNAYK